jgi:hypothetical protein
MSQTFEDRLNQIIPKLTSADFLNNQGLGNEIGFWIFDYPPEREIEMREFLNETIKPALLKKQPAIKTVVVDLFDLIIGVLEDRNILDKAIEMQRVQGDTKALESLRRVLKEDKLAETLAADFDVANLE